MTHALTLTPRQAIALQAEMARQEGQRRAIDNLTTLRLTRAAQQKPGDYKRTDAQLEKATKG